MNQIIKSNYQFEDRGSDLENRYVIGYITTRDIDRDNKVIIPEGIDLTNYEKTGSQVLFEHGYRIGNAEWVKLDNKINPKGLIAKPVFDQSKEGDDALYLLKNKKINSFSITILPDDKFISRGIQKETIFNKSEMIEFSVVVLPMNPNCIVVDENKLLMRSLKSEVFKEVFNEQIKETEIEILKRDLSSLVDSNNQKYQLFEDKLNQINEAINQLNNSQKKIEQKKSIDENKIMQLVYAKLSQV